MSRWTRTRTRRDASLYSYGKVTLWWAVVHVLEYSMSTYMDIVLGQTYDGVCRYRCNALRPRTSLEVSHRPIH